MSPFWLRVVDRRTQDRFLQVSFGFAVRLEPSKKDQHWRCSFEVGPHTPRKSGALGAEPGVLAEEKGRKKERGVEGGGLVSSHWRFFGLRELTVDEGGRGQPF